MLVRIILAGEKMMSGMSYHVPVFVDSYNELNMFDYKQLFVVFEFEVYFPLRECKKSDYRYYQEKFANFMNIPLDSIVVFDNYHQRKKNRHCWYIEPDSSLLANGFCEKMGMEFVSPWIPGYLAMETLNQFREFALKYRAITNERTGCHINIRFARKPKQFDWLKLILIAQDERDLYTFGRQKSSYATHTVQCIREFQKLKHDYSLSVESINQFKSTVISDFIPEKYHAISLKKYINDAHGKTHGFIEFRAPGGDYLNAKFLMLQETLRKYLSAMCVANTNHYDKEYQLRLIKLFNSTYVPRLQGTKKERILKKRDINELKSLLSSNELENIGFIKEDCDWIDLTRLPKNKTVEVYWKELKNETVTVLPVWFKKMRVQSLFLENNHRLISLKNISSEVGSLTIKNCQHLRSLSGGLRQINELVIEECHSLKTLKGLKSKIKIKNIVIMSCEKFSLLTGMPTHLEIVYLKNLPSLSTLQGLENTTVKNELVLHNCGIINFIGCPDSIGFLTIKNCTQLNSLEGLPKIKHIRVDSLFLEKFSIEDIEAACGGVVYRIR